MRSKDNPQWLADQLEALIRAQGFFDFIKKEEIAKRFKTPEHFVEQALHILNLKGLVTQAIHHSCDDSRPDSKCWHPDVFRIIDETD